MRLGDVMGSLGLSGELSDIAVHSVQIDSRSCTGGTLFFALPGSQVDGGLYAAQAVGNGAVCVVATHELDVDVPLIVVDEAEIFQLCTEASSAIVGHPERDAILIGVTGTNGKTSVATTVAMLAQGLGWNGASIGTLTNERTTPAAPELLRTLADLAKTFDDEAENSVVALEVSSHALDQHRIDGLVFDAVAFTNLTHDHLDYHLTMENYAAAKAKLFSPTFAETAVLWVDDQFGQELFERTTLTAHAVSQIDASNVVMTLEGTSFEWRGRSMHSPLLGSYNLDNVLVALTLLSSVGASDEALETALGTISPVPGRFDVLRGKGLTVIVDYAHTPDGLQRLLRDVRALAPAARLHCVFGCGGDRDVAKRPEMGAVALEGADVVYVTSDNPRSEDPEAILDDIVRGMSASDRVHRIVDRAEAIRHAIDESAPGDVVIVAGKGHETTQTIGSEVHAFSDRHVVAESLE